MGSVEYLSPASVAKRLDVSTRTVYQWLRTGKLPAGRIGRTWRVSSAKLEAVMAKRNGKAK